MIGTGKLAVCAGRVLASLLIGTVTTVVLVVTLPRAEDAATVLAAELVRLARVER